MATKDYAAIAAAKINRPAESKSLPRILAYSRNKKGKTTFSISAGVANTLVLDPEGGTDEMKKSNPFRWPIEKWTDLDDALNYLRFSKHPYTWISADGMTKFANMALKHVMRIQEERSLDRIPGFVQKQDYGKAGELMKDFIGRLHAMPMGVVFTAQERQQEAYNDDEEDEDSESSAAAYVPDLPKGARGALNAVVDVIGRIYVVRIDGKPQRRMFIGESPMYDTGYRSDFELPPVLANPTVPRLVRLMRTGSPVPPKKTAVKKAATTTR